MVNNTVGEATRDLTTSLRQTNQAVVDSLSAVQDQNLHYTQSVSENGLDLLKHNAESTRRLMHMLTEQSHKQQEVFWTFTRLSWQTYIDFLLTPFTISREMTETARTLASRELESAERAINGQEAAQKASRK